MFETPGSPPAIAFLQILTQLVQALSNLSSGVTASLGITTTNSPVAWTASIGVASAQIIAANTVDRVGIIIHNPGTVDLYVCPSTDSAGAPLAAGGAGSILLSSGQSLPVSGLCSTAWNAVAASGVANPVTVLEFLR